MPEELRARGGSELANALARPVNASRTAASIPGTPRPAGRFWGQVLGIGSGRLRAAQGVSGRRSGRSMDWLCYCKNKAGSAPPPTRPAPRNLHGKGRVDTTSLLLRRGPPVRVRKRALTKALHTRSFRFFGLLHSFQHAHGWNRFWNSQTKKVRILSSRLATRTTDRATSSMVRTAMKEGLLQ
jgi:hypothetical protein